MSFDALTIGGVAVALLAGGFLVAVVSHNDRRSRKRGTAEQAPEGVGSKGA
jgi:hypothetical protein